MAMRRSSSASRTCCVRGSFSLWAFGLRFLTIKNRFIHLRLLLYRPMFTQLCSDERAGSSRRSDIQPVEKNIIYSSVFSKCAASCVMAAIDLVSLVHETYRTTVTDAWWYNGFCSLSIPLGFIHAHQLTCTRHIDCRVHPDNVIFLPFYPGAG